MGTRAETEPRPLGSGWRFFAAAFLLMAAGSGRAIVAQGDIPVVSDTGIVHIARLVDQCPTNDPAYRQIRADFQIRRGGVPSGELACTEPISRMPLALLTEELIYVQALRVLYYMDRGRGGYLPWTSLRMYDWMKSKIAGINIMPLPGAAAGVCCQQLEGRTFIALNTLDAANRDAARRWQGLSGRLGLVAHEARHVDGFPHATCCESPNCDQTYNERNLSPIGIQNWLWRALLAGTINVGAYCDFGHNVAEMASFLLTAANVSNGPRSFCDVKPPQVSALPEKPGGACSLRTLTLAENGVANAASYQTGRAAPGLLMTLFAGGLTVGEVIQGTLDASGRVATTLASTRVYFNGTPAPMIYVAPAQLAAVAPFALPAGRTVFVEAEHRGRLTDFVPLLVAPSSPGIFTLDASGRGPAAAINEDGNVNGAENAAGRGEIVAIYATGGGQTIPPALDGEISQPPLAELRGQVAVAVGGRAAEIHYAGPAPGLVAGVIQVNFRVPAEVTPATDVPLVLTVGGIPSAGQPTIAVK